MNTSKRYTLGKPERLKSRKQIEHLFKEGKSFNTGTLKIFHSLREAGKQFSPVPLQFGVGVGTRYFKKAVDRNRVKRLIREAYRLQKEGLHQQINLQQKQLNLFIIFTGKEVPDYKLVFEKVGAALKKLCKEYT